MPVSWDNRFRAFKNKNMVRNKFRPFLPVIILFIIVNAFLIAARTSIESRGFDQPMLIYANILLLAATFFSYLIARRGLVDPNPNAFVRSITGSLMAKMLLVIIAIVIYVFSIEGEINKPSLFAAMALYLVYTFIEVGILTKQVKQKDHA